MADDCLSDQEAAQVRTALSRARTALILDKPFLGALVLRLPMVAADLKWCRTTATDARTFYYNPRYIAALDPSQIQFVLAHEALHCALSHFSRRLHRNQSRWDLACNHAINPLLVRDGLRPPPGWLIMESFLGMTAEEIYPYIEANDADEPMDRHVYDGEERQSQSPSPSGKEQPDPEKGTGQEGEQRTPNSGTAEEAECDEEANGAPQPPPLDANERDTLAIQWQQRLAGASQLARQAGKLSGDLARLVEHLLQPQLPWRMLLARYLSTAARDDYSFQRPSRREGPYILPSLRSGQLDVTVALDVSGSISDTELQEFLAEINAIKGQVRARITLHACDEHLASGGPWIFESWEMLSLPPSLQGGGGTSFLPVFNWLADCDRAPDLLIYFTDAQGQFPPREPFYPVLWLIKGKASIPWGTRIQLN
ncbi:conserved hypothetical protein [Gammaproteobacteria bacterium]